MTDFEVRKPVMDNPVARHIISGVLKNKES